MGRSFPRSSSIASIARRWSPVRRERQRVRSQRAVSVGGSSSGSAPTPPPRRALRRRTASWCSSSSSNASRRRAPSASRASRGKCSAVAPPARSGRRSRDAHPRGQRLDDVGERVAVLAHEREDLRRGDPFGRRVLRDRALDRGDLARTAACAADAVRPWSLPFNMSRVPGGYLLLEPGLVEERHLRHAGGVGDGGLDQRLHAPPAHGPRCDRAHLDEHGRGLPGPSVATVRASPGRAGGVRADRRPCPGRAPRPPRPRGRA